MSNKKKRIYVYKTGKLSSCLAFKIQEIKVRWKGDWKFKYHRESPPPPSLFTIYQLCKPLTNTSKLRLSDIVLWFSSHKFSLNPMIWFTDCSVIMAWFSLTFMCMPAKMHTGELHLMFSALNYKLNVPMQDNLQRARIVTSDWVVPSLPQGL